VVGPLPPVCLGGEEAQRAVGPVGVVLDAPVLCQHLHFERAAAVTDTRARRVRAAIDVCGRLVA